jgi:hypothetical protein
MISFYILLNPHPGLPPQGKVSKNRFKKPFCTRESNKTLSPRGGKFERGVK